jgi:CheY-like chemotaxis protein
MDLQMPEMDGHTATRLLRADRRFDDLPIVAMTAHALVEERQRCLQVGMNDHVSKPLDPDALFATLARWTKRRDAIEAEAATARSPTGADQPELPVIEGVDTAAGLSRVAGNKRLYRNLLEQFCDKQVHAAAEIAEAVKSGDSSRAQRVAHTVKGVAGNLGITCVQEGAAAVERAIRESVASVPSLLTTLDSALISQVQAIRSALISTTVPTAPPAEFNATAAATAMARLKLLLETNDGDSADQVENVAEAVRGRVDEQCISALRSAVADFDFERAAVELKAIACTCDTGESEPNLRAAAQ